MEGGGGRVDEKGGQRARGLGDLPPELLLKVVRHLLDDGESILKVRAVSRAFVGVVHDVCQVGEKTFQ